MAIDMREICLWIDIEANILLPVPGTTYQQCIMRGLGEEVEASRRVFRHLLLVFRASLGVE